MLPKLHDNITDQITHEQHQQAVAADLKKEQAKGPKGKNNLLLPDHITQGNFQVMDDLEEDRQAFKGDFGDLDVEIKC